jgi:hypothetical protein
VLAVSEAAEAHADALIAEEEIRYCNNLLVSSDARSHVCDGVVEVDAMVQSGAVRRQAAAYMASKAEGVYGYTLLGVLLLYGQDVEAIAARKLKACRCLDIVLAWGVCPTMARSAMHSVFTGWITGWTPLAFGYPITPQAMQSLLAYGSFPAKEIKVKDGHYTVRGRHGKAEAQWLRWHGRSRRRLWALLASKNCLK